jgi:3-hydroxyacyl-[acyl-carrier-protein] dehydratase
MQNQLSLPMPAETFIPHRLPMRLVETLLRCGEDDGLVEARPAADGILTDADGFLDEVALVELLAQGYAVVKGYNDLLQGKEICKGYLVGIKKLRITGRARAGDRLLIRIRTVGSFEEFTVAQGEIEIADTVIAAGTMKLWVDRPGSAAGGAA